MSVRKKTWLLRCVPISLLSLLAFSVSSAQSPDEGTNDSLAHDTIAQQLGWVQSSSNYCGGYYVEPPFVYPVSVEKQNSIEITSDQTLFSQHGTSILEGQVTITRQGQQMTSNKAYLYRDPATGKLSAVEMVGDVHLREPNTLVIGKKGRYNFETRTKSLMDILYRTSLNGRQVVGPNVTDAEMEKERKITTLTAWGQANEFSSTEPKIYELSQSTFSTCPPTNPAWKVKASHIVLNKNTGRGYATNARFLIKGIPVFYMPYINFSIDGQRKTGFLWPTVGTSNRYGPYFLAPFYWNMAPNYDMTLTPGYLSKRGVQVSDKYRYLTETSTGTLNASVLPNDRFFSDFQSSAPEKTAHGDFGNPADPTVQAELNRLENASTTRKALSWRDKSQFTNHWSSDVDFNYAGDDYYLRDFGSNLNEISQNQLLQQGDLYYKGQNWNFTGRVQAYETVHPLDESAVDNPYRRFPQLVLNGDYPDQPYGLEYFIDNEATHFDILKTPGSNTEEPVGNRLNTQPGISLPLYWTSFYLNPRLQAAFTDYNLQQTSATNTPPDIKRAIPIFDVASGVTLDRDLSLFHHGFEQTLEPQVYYTYIPYRNQQDIPVFDTTVNTLNYDQIFNYNRFSGIDRIGDANQVGLGVTTRLIDQDSGLEKVRMGVGEIVYFKDREVTLCNSPEECNDNPDNPNNHYRLSPISGLLNYNMSAIWGASVNSIWNPTSKQLENTTLGLHYEPDPTRVVNLGYSYAYNGDPVSGVVSSPSSNNLKVTDFSFAWPAITDVSLVGRWSQNWNHDHLQNLLYGVQYDTCCWAVRFVAGRAFTNLSANNNTPQYNSEFYLQFALKGMGNVGTGDPTSLLSSISGYNSQFGQVI